MRMQVQSVAIAARCRAWLLRRRVCIDQGRGCAL